MKRLIIGPGSMIMFQFLGVLKKLSLQDQCKDLEEISAASIGALIGFFYVYTCGDVDRMLEMAVEAPLDKLAKVEVRNLMSKFGLIDLTEFERYVDALCPMTFKELYDHNPIKLHVTTYNLVTDRTVYLSVDTAPDMKVSRAVRMSITVPLIMVPWFGKDGGLYLDGATVEHSPCHVFLGKTDVLEIRKVAPSTPQKRPSSLMKYLTQILYAFMRNQQKYNEFPRIDVECHINTFDFSLTREKKIELYLSAC